MEAFTTRRLIGTSTKKKLVTAICRNKHLVEGYYILLHNHHQTKKKPSSKKQNLYIINIFFKFGDIQDIYVHINRRHYVYI